LDQLPLLMVLSWVWEMRTMLFAWTT
jgi:hypothetical protein